MAAGNVPQYLLFFAQIAWRLAWPLRLEERSSKVFPQGLVTVRSVRIAVFVVLAWATLPRHCIHVDRDPELLSP